MNQTILLPEQPRVTAKSGNQAHIEVAGCYPGYGMTIGNALRRVLLSSLPGAAITAVKITGVPHEFVTIPGVIEDVTMLILNLKQVRFRVTAETPLTVMLVKKGKGEVLAGDIQTVGGIEVANPELHIATLTAPDATLEMEITVEQGMGYVPVEEHRREKVEIGLIALDAMFSPIKRVNYETKNMRVGNRTDFNLISFDIETDGTMTPEDAFGRAVVILVEQFEKLKDLDITTQSVPAVAEAVKEEEAQALPTGGAEVKELSAVSLEDLGLKTRVAKALEAAGIATAADIVAKTEEEMLAVEGLGEKAIKDIKKAVGKRGFTLAEKK